MSTYTGLIPFIRRTSTLLLSLSSAASHFPPPPYLLSTLPRELILFSFLTFLYLQLGQTALHRCADKGQAKMAFDLLELGCNPNIQDKKGNTPLHLAKKYKHQIIADCLLSKGADSKIRNKVSVAYSKVFTHISMAIHEFSVLLDLQMQ